MAGNPDYWRLRPRAPAVGSVLGPVAAIPPGGGREYVFGRGAAAFSMFVIRARDGAADATTVRGWLNICPHFSLKLNQRGHAFTNPDGTRIRCTMHFAEFRLEDGLCVAGACEGEYLDPVPVRVIAGQIEIGP